MSALYGTCPACGSTVGVTGRGTIARHTTRSKYSYQAQHCDGSAKPATGVEAWAEEHLSCLRRRIDGHGAEVAAIRAKAAQDEASADKRHAEALAEVDAIGTALAAHRKAARKAAASPATPEAAS